MKLIKWLLIFLLIHLVLTGLADYSDVIHGGLDVLSKLGPEAEGISSAVGFIYDILAGIDKKDPTAEIIDAINDLGQKIETKLDYIEDEIRRYLYSRFWKGFR